MVRLTQRSTILLSDSIFVFVLATAQLTAVSSPVVQRHIPWNRKARAGGVWCEAFAPQPAESQGETPPFVSLHHGMTEAFSGGCSPNILTPCVMHDLNLGEVEDYFLHILQNVLTILMAF